MKWNYNDLINWIKNGCDKLIGDTITELDINNHHYALSSTWVPEYGQFRIYPNQTTYVHERLVTRVPIRP